MSKLAIIGGGGMAGIFASNAREMGIETHCFSKKDGIVSPELFDYIHNLDILDKENLLKLCRELLIDGIVCTTELTIAPAAYVAEKLNLVGIPFSIAEVITDKYRNREVSKNVEGLNHPKYSEVYSIDDIKNLEYTYPIILKPISRGGKRGITVINSIEEIENAFNYAVKETNSEFPFIVEEFIDGGMECSVESLSYNGVNHIIQVTEKVTSGAPHCVELEHHQPANISMQLRKKVERVIDAGLTAIGLTNGACHTEIKIKNGEIYLIEFNARPGGDHIAFPLTQLSTGYPYIKGAIQIALNCFKYKKADSNCKKFAGVIFITEQTKKYKKIFDNCDKYDWCYKKNFINDKLDNIIHNDGFNKNYFIYYSDYRPNFDEEE